MLKWHRNCYIGEIVKDLPGIRKRLENGRAVPGIYLLALSENPRNLLEIFPAVTLMQRTAASLCPEIIGIAKGKDEAFGLVESIVREIYRETGDVQVKEYFKNR